MNMFRQVLLYAIGTEFLYEFVIEIIMQINNIYNFFLLLQEM